MNELIENRRITITKGRAVGCTTSFNEKMVEYYMMDMPHGISYTHSSDKLIEKWKKKLTPLLSDILND